MLQCLILGCSSVEDPADTSGGVLFFDFPSDPNIRRKWCRNIEAFQGPLTEYTKVCERHFEPEVFVGGRCLKRDAVPSLFYEPPGNKSLLEIINGCIEQDESGQVRCRLIENGLSCGFSKERFESRALLRHICEAHSTLARLVGLTVAKRSIKTTPIVHGKGVKLTKKVLSHLSLEPDGYHCRIEDSSCLYFNPNMNPANFARHFRDMHPMQAFDNGYFEGFRREDICLKKRVKFKNRNETIKTTVRSKVVYDGTRYRCNIGRSQCDYSVKIFNTRKIRKHFCDEHPAEASQCRLFKTKRSHQNGDNLPSGQESLSFKLVQLVDANVVRTRNGIVRCRIGDPDCRYKRRKYVPANFLYHFCIYHPEEARAKGFFESETKNSEESSERQLTPTPIDTKEDHNQPKQNSSHSIQENCPKAPEQRVEEFEDDDLRLTTPSDDPATYCRLCFSIAQPLQPIFAGPKDIDGDGSLVELISNCTNIRLCAQTDYPSSICYECQQKLDDIQRFRQLCETLDAVVRRQGRINKVFLAESDEEPEVAPRTDETIAMGNEDRVGQQSALETMHCTELKIRGQTYMKCVDCGFLAKSGKNVRRHWKTVHNGRNKSDKVIKCNVTGCSEIFFTSRSHLDHSKILHRIPTKIISPAYDGIKYNEVYVKLGESQYACRNCGKLYPTFQFVVTHFRQSHRRSKIYRNETNTQNDSVDDVCQVVAINGVSYFKCRDCEVLMVKKADVAVHWLQQHGGGGNGR